MKDKILLAMNQMLDRWKRVKEKRSICDQIITLFPRMITMTLKHIDEVRIIADDGGLTTSPENSLSPKAGFRVRVAIGGSEGVGIDSLEGYVPPRDLYGLRQIMDDMLDKGWKQALSQYFEHHEQISLYERKRIFEKLSLEDPVNYRELEKNFNPNIEKLSLWIEQASKFLQNLKEVESSEIFGEFWRENRRFVRLEQIDGKELRSSIFTSQVWGTVKFEVQMRDAKGRLVQFGKRLVRVNLQDFTKDSILTSAKKLSQVVKEMSQAKVQESGCFKVIFDPKSFGVLLHEGGAAHLLSARYIYGEESTTFRSHVGKRVFPSFLILWDDSTISDGFGSFKFDEDGVPAQKTLLVKNGVLKTFLHDRISAGRGGLKSNGKARSEKIREPEPRISNLVVETTKSYPAYSTEDLIQMMIKDLKQDGQEYGLFIRGGGGDVDTETGEYRMYPNTAYRIYTDGHREPVTSFFICQEAHQSLQNIVALGKEKEVCYGFCGAESGLVPVQEVSRMAYVKSVETPALGGKIPRKRLLKKLDPDEYEDFDEDDD